MNYYLDTEFSENGRTIDLISIGIVAEDDREFYRVRPEAVELCQRSSWLIDNVLPHLPPKDSRAWRASDTIARELLAFIGHDPKPVFWAYYADYDWVAVCQLYGRMIDLPAHFPKFCMDLKQLSVSVGSPRHPKQTGTAHDALEDARYAKELHRFLKEHGDVRTKKHEYTLRSYPYPNNIDLEAHVVAPMEQDGWKTFYTVNSLDGIVVMFQREIRR